MSLGGEMAGTVFVLVSLLEKEGGKKRLDIKRGDFA